jgi:putative transposase
MRAPYTQLYLHCVWATWDRLPLVTPEIEARLYTSIGSNCRELNCEMVAIGGDVDHVHLLVRLPTTISVANLLKEVKGASSHLMTHGIAPNDFFKWQGGYGAFTVSKDGVKAVADYINNQKAHHAARSLVEDWEKCEIGEGRGD